MKNFFTILVVFASVSIASATSAEEQSTSFVKKHVEFEKAEDSALMTSTVTYYTPQVYINGRLQRIWIDFTNGTQFCRQNGHSNQVDGGTIYCGEDEDSFADYDWYAGKWIFQDSGSANQCYPLFSTIKCR